MVTKRALFKDTVREIRHTLGRFLSILCITALGTAFFSGIKTAAPVMKNTFDAYAKDTNFMDVRFVSTVGFDDVDVRAIAKLKSVSAVQPTYQADVLAQVGDANAVVTLICANRDETDLNRQMVLKGRMPQTETECAVDVLHFSGVSVGDTLHLSSGTSDPLSDTVTQDTLTVVGVVRSPLYIALVRDNSTIGSGVVDGFVVVDESLFALDVYTDVYVRVDGARGISVFEDAYDGLVDPVIEQGEDLGKRRGTQWYMDTVAQAKNTLAQKQQEYDDAVAEADRRFDRAQRDINRGWAEIEEGEETIASARDELAAQQAQGEADIRQAREALANEQAAYDQAYADYLSTRDSMAPEQRAQTESDLAAWKSAIETQAALIDQNEQNLNQTIAAATAELDAQEQALIKGRADLRAAQRRLNRERADAEEEFADAREQLVEVAQDIEDIPEAKWYVLGHDANMGFVDYRMSADRMKSITRIFPTFFFVIAALVCLTTMTRMVDEQRGNMGTLKALGYTKRDIASKYLIYAAIASVLGSVIGVLIGMWLFPYTIFSAYSMMFTLPGPNLFFHVGNAALAVAIAVSVIMAATLLACYRELHDAPASLMRPKAPKAGKLILLERIGFVWRRMNFSNKVTARNLFRYKKRLFMTLIGIAGCTALLLTGFGIRDSIKTLAQTQYGDVFLYEVSVATKSDLPASSIHYLTERIGARDGVETIITAYGQSMDFYKTGSEQAEQATLMVFADDGSMQQAISMQERVSKRPVHLPQTGAIITEKMGLEMGIGIGDVLVMRDGESRFDITVTGFTENYIRHYVYISEDAYRAATGKTQTPNQLFINATGGTDLNALCEYILTLPNTSQVSAYTNVTEAIADTVAGLDSVVWVLILTAMALAFVVMYNLTNINIGERIREIATLKVLGFTRREVAMYVFRENILLSLLGIGLGSGFGIILHKFVMTSLEVEGTMFGRQIFPMSFLVAAAMTFAFTMLVNFAMLPRLRNIDMVESLKTVE